MKRLFILAILCMSFALISFGQKKVPVATTKEATDCVPKITTKAIRSFLYGKSIIDASGNNLWIFEKDELIEIDIIETKIIDEKHIVSVVQIKSGDAPGSIRVDKQGNYILTNLIEGRIRLSFEYIAGEWNLLKIENLSAKDDHLEVNVVQVDTQ